MAQYGNMAGMFIHVKAAILALANILPTYCSNGVTSNTSASVTASSDQPQVKINKQPFSPMTRSVSQRDVSD